MFETRLSVVCALLEGVKRILVVKLRHHGDVLLTAPLFTSLKHALPEAQIDAYIYKETYPMLEGHPAISRFHLYDKGWKNSLWRYLYEAHLLWQMRKYRYDLVINLTEGDRGAIVAFLSGARLRVGVDPKGGGMWGKERLYTHLIAERKGTFHTVETQLDALRTLGIEPNQKDLLLYVSAECDDKMRSLVPQNYLLIHPVSRWMFKAWPAPKMHALIKELLTRGHQIVLTSGPAKAELDFVHQVAGDLPVINLAGKTSLKELAALIKNAKAMITVDSVPMHMAAAFKTPLVAIFGPSSEVRWAPWKHPNAQIVTHDMPCRPCFQAGCSNSGTSQCLVELPPSKVLTAFERVLQIH